VLGLRTAKVAHSRIEVRLGWRRAMTTSIGLFGHALVSERRQGRQLRRFGVRDCKT